MNKLAYAVLLIVLSGCSKADHVDLLELQKIVDETDEVPHVQSSTNHVSEEENMLIRKTFPHQYEQKFLTFVNYVKEPDEITKKLTEAIFYMTWFMAPTTNFATIDEADPYFLQANAVMSTEQLNIDDVQTDDQRNYLKRTSLDGHMLREHVVQTGQTLLG